MNSYLNKKLELKNIKKLYQGEYILNGVNIYLKEGETVSILGRSGSGKTTLFNIASGLLKPESGEVVLNGKNITGEVGHVGYMLQKDLLLPHLTIVQNVALPLILANTDKKTAKEKVVKFFKDFGLEGTEEKYPRQLSGGMRQRAAFLRTYIGKKDVILLDEPFSALDMITKSNLHIWYSDIMKRLNLSTIFITHDIEEAVYLSDRIYILDEGLNNIVEEIEIEAPNPKSPDFKLSREFLEYRKKIMKLL